MQTTSTRGFTLIEVLVAVSIILLLVAILLPVLASIQRSARLSACQANVGSIVQAFTPYLARNDRVYPGIRYRGTPVGEMSLLGVQGTDSAMGGTVPENRRPLNAHLSEVEEVAQCPLDIGGMGGDTPIFERFGTSYWYPAHPANQPTTQRYARHDIWLFGGRPAGHREIANPARKLVVADAVVLPSEFPDGEPRSDWHGTGDPPGVTVGFADGSVRQLERKGGGSAQPTQASPDQIRGWAGAGPYY